MPAPGSERGPEMADVRKELARVLREGEETVERRLEDFLADPDDVETVHRLRISIRTLRSLLAFVSPLLKRRRHRILQDDLRSVVIETSRLREYDVLLRQVRALDVPYGELAEKIAGLRELERNHVVDVMRGRHTRRALRRVRKALARLPWRDSVREAGVSRAEVREIFRDLVCVVDEGYAVVDQARALRERKLRGASQRGRRGGGTSHEGRPGPSGRHLRRARERGDGGGVSRGGALR